MLTDHGTCKRCYSRWNEMRNWVKNENVQMVAVALATAVGAQFKINPFREDYFRIGLGVSIFLFLLMIMPHLSYLKTGILTGLASFAFQSTDLIYHVHSLSVLESMRDNLGAGLYYVVFAYGLSKINIVFTKYLHSCSAALLRVLIFPPIWWSCWYEVCSLELTSFICVNGCICLLREVCAVIL